MNWQRLVGLFIWVLPALITTGQELSSNNFRRYTTEDGLSHNNVYTVTQDPTGYIWASTSAGLVRYNGTRFVQYHSNNDSLSLSSEDLTGMTWISKDELAVHTVGVHIINTRTGETKNLYIPYHDKKYEFKFNMVERIKGDGEGNIFVITRSGFYHFDKDKKLVSRFDYYTEAQVQTEHFFFGREIIELDSKNLLIVSIGGLYIYNKDTRQSKKYKPEDYPILADFADYPDTYYTFFQKDRGELVIFKYLSDTVTYINTAQNKKVYSILPFRPPKLEFHYRTKLFPVSDTLFYVIGQLSGFFKVRFYPETGKMKMYPDKYFSTYQCNSVIRDKDNNLWVGTSKGLFRQDPSKSQVQVLKIPDPILDSFANIKIDDIYVNSKDIYAGARGTAGLLVFDKHSGQFKKQVRFKKYGNSLNYRGNQIDAILPLDSNTLMLGTDWPVLKFDIRTDKEKQLWPPDWEDGDWTNDLFKDSQGNIWIAAFHTYKYNPVTNKYVIVPIPSRLLEVPFWIAEDRDGNIWFAGHGLARYNSKADSFDLLLDSFPYIKMMDKQVNSMVIDPHNTVWFNSYNNGLIAYDIDKKTYRHFTRKDGLPDDNVASMIVVGDKLWLACFNGMACMDLRNSSIISFGKDDGFPTMPITVGARFFYDTTVKQLYIGYSFAVVRFNPFDILRRKSPPNVFIESITRNDNKNLPLNGNTITTSWGNTDMLIRIGSINYNDGNSETFAYRIAKDAETPWQQLGSQPSFNISGLAPGDHRIQVKVSSNYNRWPPQIKEFNLSVLPPFWMKEWFIALLTLLVMVMIYLLVKWRTNIARKKEMEKTNLEKLKADDYKSQFELEQISHYFSSSLADKKTEDEVLWDVAQNLIGRMNYEDCIIYLWNEDKTKLVQKAAYGPKGNPEIISEQVFEVLPGEGVVGHVVESMRPVLVSDTRTDSRYRVDDAFRLSEVCVPIIHNDELLGVIDSEHTLANYFTERDIKILTTIATLIANKLKQIESEKSLEVTHRELVSINEQLAEAQLSALQAQMNPHFVFNALNSIKRMILEGDNERASRYLSKFALMIRMTLNHSKELFVTLDENIEYLKAYLEMEQLRFDDSFSYSIFTDDNIDAMDTPIPSLMIQPIVENAIWHGLLTSLDDKRLKIGFTQYQNKITCTVEDNGIGYKKAQKLKEVNKPPHQSVGLENLKKRIKIMNEKFDTDCSLEITDLNENGHNNGHGTKVVLRFNVINV